MNDVLSTMLHKKSTTYLSDHFAGSEAALEIMDNIESRYADSPAASIVARIRPEIDYERVILRGILDQMNVQPSTTRRVFGWLSEKFVEMKLHIDDADGSRLRLLESLEMLGLGVSGKIALWNALAAVQQSESALASVDFAKLLEMARVQQSEIESVRILAARDALIE